MILSRVARTRPVRTLLTWLGAVALAIGLVLATCTPALAHDIPARATVLAFVRPHGRVLRLLVRVPLETMRDVQLPLRDGVYLDVARATPLLADAARTWIADGIDTYENDAPLAARVAAVRVSLPTDRAYASWPTALATVTGPPLAGADTSALPWRQAMLDVALDYDIASDRSRFSIRLTLARLALHTNTVLRFLPPDGSERAFEYAGDPGLVRLDPRWHQAALTFVRLGFEHIMSGIDHLLFVLCLVIPIRRWRSLLAVVTSFTVAHSITLAASAFGVAPSSLWFPPLVEVLVALSIVYMALENIVGARLDRRWAVAFAFGLVHGFAFSFALRESMQFAGAHLATGLLAFNVGVELGQLAVIAVAVPLLALMFTHVVKERMGVILCSALVAHTAWHWMLDRGAALAQYRVEWPALDRELLASVVRGALLLAVIVGVLWVMSILSERITRREAAAR